MRDQVEEIGGSYPYSYIEEIWDHAYLDIRDPLPVHVNPAYLLQYNDADTFGGDYLKTAAALSVSLAKWAHKLRTKDLEVDTPPSCMAPYINLLGSARIPQKVDFTGGGGILGAA